MANNTQFKINQIAKDLGKKSKDIVEVLVAKGIDVKNSQKTLEAEEFDILFDTLTKDNQITEIENYIDGITYIPAKEKPVEETQAKTEEKPAEEKKEIHKQREVSRPASYQNLVKTGDLFNQPLFYGLLVAGVAAIPYGIWRRRKAQ